MGRGCSGGEALVRAVLGVVAIAVLVAGCGVGERAVSGDPTGAPVSATSAAEATTTAPRGRVEEPFDPCAEVPARVLEANGFDASTAKAGLLGEVDGDIVACRWWSHPDNTWHNETYRVTALRYEFAVDSLRSRPDFAGLEDVVVNGRGGTVFWFADRPNTSCYVAFETRTGRTAMVAVGMHGAAQVRPRIPGELGCTEMVLRHARWLEPHLPR